VHDGLAWFYRLFFSVGQRPQYFYAAVIPSGGSERREFILTCSPYAVKEAYPILQFAFKSLRSPHTNEKLLLSKKILFRFMPELNPGFHIQQTQT